MLMRMILEQMDSSEIPQDEEDEYAQPAEYCVGKSVNADLQWKKKRNVEFLKTKNVEEMKNLIKSFAGDPQIGKMKIVNDRVEQYGDHNPEFGFTYYVTLGQSHIAIHTWPEQWLMNIDIFTCGDEGDPVAIYERVVSTLKPDRIRKNEFGRSKGLDWHTWEDKEKDPDAKEQEQAREKFYKNK